MTFIWFIVWLIANNVGGNEPLIAKKKVVLKKDYIHHVVDVYQI